jgi:hypothetical protein
MVGAENRHRDASSAIARKNEFLILPHLPPMGVGIQVIVMNHDLAFVGDMRSQLHAMGCALTNDL